MEDVSPHDELKWLDVQAQLATELAGMKALYSRLNEIIQAFAGDFEVQLAANEVKQRMMARGLLLKARESAPPLLHDPPAQPPASPAPLPDTVADERAAPDAAVLPQPPPPANSAPREQPPPQRPARPTAPARTGRTRKRALVVGSSAGVLVLLALISGALYQAHNNAARSQAAVEVGITTAPTGASVRVTGEQSVPGRSTDTTCTSNCKLALVPGTYRIAASLNGFEPAAGAVTVRARQPAAVSLTLQPQAQSVRLLTDLDHASVVVDGQPPAELQEGQFILDKVAPGAHTVKVTGQNGSVSFSFEIADARMPVVAGPVNAQNLVAMLVASFGKQARVVTNAGPWKLAVNGQAQGDAGPAGTDLTSFQPGVNEIVVGEGGDQRNMSESFGSAPMLTAFLKTDVNAGTLIVSAGQDDVRVFLNDKEYRRGTLRGQLRVQTLGKVAVRVAKSGFLDAPAQTVEVKKGSEVRVQFDLKPQPQFGSLQIHGAAAGTEVIVDQKSAGTVAPDGSFSLGNIRPGDHAIELRREQYVPKRLQRSFNAGQAVVLADADVVLAAANATVRLTRNPAAAAIAYRRGDETESHEVRENQIELPAGSYSFSAKAPGFSESTTRVQLAAGETRDLGFTLAAEKPAAPPPAAAGGMADFENAQAWKKDGDIWAHKGGGFVPYKLPPKGIFTFTVELVKGGGRSGQVRWCVQYLDARTYLLYELDRKNFWAGVVEKGKRLERVKVPDNLGNQKTATIQIEVSPDRLVQKLRVGDDWKVLDTFVEAGRDFTQGKFGFLVQGNDEVAVSDFKFQPK